jgi:hypothetical protein
MTQIDPIWTTTNDRFRATKTCDVRESNSLTFSQHCQLNRKAEQDPCRARESLRHALPVRRDPFVSGVRDFILEKRLLVANSSADLAFLA